MGPSSLEGAEGEPSPEKTAPWRFPANKRRGFQYKGGRESAIVKAARAEAAPPAAVMAPALYARLESAYGELRVGNPGQEAVYGWGARRGAVVHVGEVYRFNCRICGDDKHRGWVSHVYGQYHPYTGEALLGLVGCSRGRGCYAGPCRKEEFALQLYGMRKPGPAPPLVPSAGGGDFAARAVALPGRTIAISDLFEGHAAARYLRDRGFDARRLAEEHELGYCADWTSREDVKYVNRLIIPFYRDGGLVGFQGRAIWKDAKVRYLTNKGPRCRGYLYGMGAVSPSSPLVVVVEGAPSVWALGPPAMAALTSSVSPDQAEALSGWGRRGATAAIWFDAGAEEKARRAAERLSAPFDGRVVIVADPGPRGDFELRRPGPSKIDPAEYVREAGWARVAASLGAAGASAAAAFAAEAGGKGGAV